MTTCGIEAAVSLRRAALPVPHALTAARLRIFDRFGAFCGTGRNGRMGFLSVVSVCAACLAVAGCASIAGPRSVRGDETEQSDRVGFRLPDIPDTLRGAARAEHLALHYWDGFDFAGADIAAPEAEQAFVDFLGLLPRISSADGAFDALFGRAAGSDGLYRLMELCDKYLYEPWSPMRSDELYAAALRAFTESPCIAEIDKVRARQALERLSTNRPGTPAADFIYVDRGGSRHRLSDIEAPHILLFFHYPGCGECRRMKAALEASPIVGESLRRGRLVLLAVCVGERDDWERSGCPMGGIDGFDGGMSSSCRTVYDLRALPTLYLLDGERCVILKDASVVQVEERLAALCSGQAAAAKRPS